MNNNAYKSLFSEVKLNGQLAKDGKHFLLGKDLIREQGLLTQAIKRGLVADNEGIISVSVAAMKNVLRSDYDKVGVPVETPVELSDSLDDLENVEANDSFPEVDDSAFEDYANNYEDAAVSNDVVEVPEASNSTAPSFVMVDDEFSTNPEHVDGVNSDAPLSDDTLDEDKADYNKVDKDEFDLGENYFSLKWELIAFGVGFLFMLLTWFLGGPLHWITGLLALGAVGALGYIAYHYFQYGFPKIELYRASGLGGGLLLLTLLALMLGGRASAKPADEQVVEPTNSLPTISVQSSESSKPSESENYKDNIKVTFGKFEVGKGANNTKEAFVPVIVENLTDKELKYNLTVQAYDATGQPIGRVDYVLNQSFGPKERKTVNAYELYQYFDLKEADELATKLVAPGVKFELVDISKQ